MINFFPNLEPPADPIVPKEFTDNLKQLALNTYLESNGDVITVQRVTGIDRGRLRTFSRVIQAIVAFMDLTMRVSSEDQPSTSTDLYNLTQAEEFGESNAILQFIMNKRLTHATALGTWTAYKVVTEA